MKCNKVLVLLNVAHLGKKWPKTETKVNEANCTFGGSLDYKHKDEKLVFMIGANKWHPPWN